MEICAFSFPALVSLPARNSPQPPNILWRTPPLLFTDPLLGGAGPTSQSQAHNFSLINRCSHPPSTKLMVWGGGHMIWMRIKLENTLWLFQSSRKKSQWSASGTSMVILTSHRTVDPRSQTKEIKAMNWWKIHEDKVWAAGPNWASSQLSVGI